MAPRKIAPGRMKSSDPVWERQPPPPEGCLAAADGAAPSGVSGAAAGTATARVVDGWRRPKVLPLSMGAAHPMPGMVVVQRVRETDPARRSGAMRERRRGGHLAGDRNHPAE